MKKFLVALMAVMAIALTSCKHETCTLYVTNNYAKSAIVLFSHDKDCRSIEEAEERVIAAPGKSYVMDKGVKLDGLYAITFICVDEEKVGDVSLENYKFQLSQDLSEFAGMATLTVFINEKGLPGVKAETL